MSSTKELKAIWDGKPEGATHFIKNSEYKYWKLTYMNGYQAFIETTGNWINVMPGKLYSIRSLSDIETIIRLQAENVELLEIVSEFVSLVEKAELEALTPATSLKKPLAKGESK
jgi:hypothetical protein